MKILYLGFNELYHTVDVVYIKGLRDNGATVIDYFVTERGLERYKKIAKFFWRERANTDLIIVGYASPQAVVFLRCLTFKKIVYNAVSSEYERMVVSRALAKPVSLKGFYYWLLDFKAVWFASLVMLESQHQVDYFGRLFLIPQRKCLVAWTGVDNTLFYYDKKTAKFSKFTVIFRGRLLPESGAEYVVEAAKKLESQDIKIIMIANGFGLQKIKALIDQLKPNNLELMTERLANEQLRTIMQQSHLCLGQLSNHPRLERTIPHKAYESLALKVPYLTARNPAISELLEEDTTCIMCNPADAEDLAQKIIWAKNNPAALDRISEQAYKLYQTALTPAVLAAKVLKKVS